MFIMLPLTLLGVGALIYYLFATASHALPLLIGLAVGLGARSAGLSPGTAVLIGAAVFLIAIAASRFAISRMSSPSARLLFAGAFALPAAVAGYAVCGALAALAGLSIVGASTAAVVTGVIAAHRLLRPAR